MDDAWSSSKKAPVWTGGEGGGAEAFAQAVSEMVNHKQVYDMLETQSQVYKSLKTSQESLTAFNDFSATLYRNTHRDFERRTKMIKDMQKDLEYIYRKLKFLKGKVEEVTGVPPDVVRATLREMDRAKAAFLGEEEEQPQRNDDEEKEPEPVGTTPQQQQQPPQAAAEAGEEAKRVPEAEAEAEADDGGRSVEVQRDDTPAEQLKVEVVKEEEEEKKEEKEKEEEEQNTETKGEEGEKKVEEVVEEEPQTPPPAASSATATSSADQERTSASEVSL
ncbi:uncharacterized protein ACA1_193120 [Acanthamoeba castellanii str. Neff]|uniref:KxDL domain-containing protein n=1 Tax=Acanthamoeba castellanii (strain ATCC 30010 / Neff) TaxID=1257118 RepID=L8GNQ6_ACACF|nr:uncharacterized protein ACA1_193120 [Acanthamoeba castellanii str. Neff]ELR14509.1 hypothetical protein ACA1_193120 [Acanthamoeba castellanii str. Neff]